MRRFRTSGANKIGTNGGGSVGSGSGGSGGGGGGGDGADGADGADDAHDGHGANNTYLITIITKLTIITQLTKLTKLTQLTQLTQLTNLTNLINLTNKTNNDLRSFLPLPSCLYPPPSALPPRTRLHTYPPTLLPSDPTHRSTSHPSRVYPGAYTQYMVNRPSQLALIDIKIQKFAISFPLLPPRSSLLTRIIDTLHICSRTIRYHIIILYRQTDRQTDYCGRNDSLAY